MLRLMDVIGLVILGLEAFQDSSHGHGDAVHWVASLELKVDHLKDGLRELISGNLKGGEKDTCGEITSLNYS